MCPPGPVETHSGMTQLPMRSWRNHRDLLHFRKDQLIA